jgi:hypothetical protein
MRIGTQYPGYMGGLHRQVAQILSGSKASLWCPLNFDTGVDGMNTHIILL